MRIRTEARRQAIVEAAAAVFRESGFERASMAQIRERVGYSKPTLYSYFASKEELFFAVVLETTEAEFEAAHAALDPATDDVAESLRVFGRSLLALVYAPPVMAVRRLVVAEAGRTDLGRRCYELGQARSEQVIEEFLAAAMQRGALRRGDPRLASLQFKALLEAEWIDRFLFQMPVALDEREVAATTDRAVAAFMAIHAPDISPRTPRPDC